MASATVLSWRKKVTQLEGGGKEESSSPKTRSTGLHMHNHRPHSLTHPLGTPQVRPTNAHLAMHIHPQRHNRCMGKHKCHRHTTHTSKYMPHSHKYTHLHTCTQICIPSTHTSIYTHTRSQQCIHSLTAHEHTPVHTCPAWGIQRGFSGVTHVLRPGALS